MYKQISANLRRYIREKLVKIRIKIINNPKEQKARFC